MKRRLIVIILFLLLVLAQPVLAANTATITVISGTTYAMLPVTTLMSNTALVTGGFITANGLDVRVSGSSPVPHMLVNDRTMFASAIIAGATTPFYYSTGNVPLLSTYVIPGYNGYITTAYNAALELGDNFSIETRGYVDTGAGAGKNMVYKSSSFINYVSGAGTVDSVLVGVGAAAHADLLPVGVGFATGITTQFPAATFHWDKVDDPVAAPDDNATYLSEAGTNTDYYTLSNIIPYGSIITTVTVYYRIKDTDAGANCGWVTVMLRLNGVDLAAAPVTTPDAWTTSSAAIGRPGGGSWTENDVANLQVGLTLTNVTAIPYCTQIYAHVDYLPPLSVSAAVSTGVHTIRTGSSAITLSSAGFGQVVGVPDAASQELGAGDFTRSMWVNFSDVTVNQSLLNHGNAIGNYELIEWNHTTNELEWSVVTPGTPLYKAAAFVPVVGTWYNLIFERAFDMWSIYVDSVAVGGPTFHADAVSDKVDPSLYGGGFIGPIGEYDGLFQDIRFLSRAITAGERTDYQTFTYTNNTDLELYLACNEGLGTVIKDSSINNIACATNGTWGSGAYLYLTIDGVIEDIAAPMISAVVVPGSDWIIDQNNVMPYIEYYKHTTAIGAVSEKIKYQPITIISGTALPNIDSGGSYPGVFTFGANPAGVSATLGALLSSGQNILSSSGQGNVNFVPTVSPKINVTSGNSGTTFPLYGLFKGLLDDFNASSGSTITMAYVWRWVAIIFAFMFGTGVLIATSQPIFGLIAYALGYLVPTLWMGGILDWWVPVMYIIGAVLLIMLVSKWGQSSIS